MSAVLQALKKIERQRAQTDRMVIAKWQIDPLMVAHGDRPKFVVKPAIAIVAAMLVVGAIGMFIWQRTTAPAPDPIHDPQVSQTSRLPANHPITLPRPLVPAVVARADIREPAALPVAAPPESPPPTARPVTLPESMSSVASGMPPLPAASPRPASPVVAAEAPASSAPGADAPVVSRLVDAGVKLQAVVWSETPDACMVVINDRILRIGDHIDGYRLVEIGPGHALLSRGGRVWRLPFMRR